jgi:hypothetical protein
LNTITAIDHGSGQSLVCQQGTVVLLPTPGIGATNATLLRQNGTTIRLRQVPGPNLFGTPLAQVNGQMVTVCGNFLVDQGQVILNVVGVFPFVQTGSGSGSAS